MFAVHVQPTMAGALALRAGRSFIADMGRAGRRVLRLVNLTGTCFPEGPRPALWR